LDFKKNSFIAFFGRNAKKPTVVVEKPKPIVQSKATLKEALDVWHNRCLRNAENNKRYKPLSEKEIKSYSEKTAEALSKKHMKAKNDYLIHCYR